MYPPKRQLLGGFAMATIYRPTFGKREEPVVVEKTSDSKSQAIDPGFDERTNQMIRILMADVEYLRDNDANTERVWNACKRGDEITNYIFAMERFHKKDESVELRQNTLATISLCVLAGYLLDSHEHQWNTQPHYFGAIILEMNMRLNTIREAVEFEVPHFN